MFKAAIKTVNLSLYKYSFIFYKNYWILLLGVILGFNTNPVDAQNNISINKNNINQPLTIRGTSGGTVKALNIARTDNTPTGYCDGFVNPQPNHILKLDTFFNNLRLEVESSADTTVLVKGVNGIWCNDDAGSANPMIEGQWQPGTYKVWVGSYQPDSQNSYQIKITVE